MTAALRDLRIQTFLVILPGSPASIAPGARCSCCRCWGRAVILGLLIYFTSFVIRNRRNGREIPELPGIAVGFFRAQRRGWWRLRPAPASHGNLPRASLDDQLAAPTVMLPKAMPKLPVEETVLVAPDVQAAAGRPRSGIRCRNFLCSPMGRAAREDWGRDVATAWGRRPGRSW